MLAILVVALAGFAAAPVSAAPPHRPTLSPSPALTVTARARVVRVSASSVMLDVFNTGAVVTAGAEMVTGHRVSFSTRSATMGGSPWSSKWRSVKRDSMLDVTVTLTPKSGTCAADKAYLGDDYCAEADYRSPLSKFFTLQLVSAAPRDGYCATGSGSRFNFGLKSWAWVGTTYRPNVCFFTVNGVPTGAGYLNLSDPIHDGSIEILVDAGKGLYFSLPAAAGVMVETRLDKLPARGSRIKVAIAADFQNDGKDVQTSKYKTVTLAR